MIDIQPLDSDQFRVTVSGSSATTSHTVTVSDAAHRQLTGGRQSKEELLRASFEFLLEREPNTSILSRFDLPVIGTYFPEYESVMRSASGA